LLLQQSSVLTKAIPTKNKKETGFGSWSR